ncbi:hypothetical protein Bca52824_033901 [Brassica carinata]|uniref:Uncharacterized protein n=1 Tax=Brassica carinata TaxID=52824 RepID=A0A8X7V6I3_BRACI|nr:hypothetical protein Bca52824_033901 [Brassica carinata]
MIRSDLFSVISVTGNGDMFLHTDYTRKGEMEDERVNLLLDRIRDKFDWSNTEWPVMEPEETKMEDIDSEAGKSVDDANVLADEADVVAEEETSSVNVPGKGKRKVNDEGAETRKKKLLCKRAAEKKQSIDRETKSFIEGLIHTSVTSLGDMLSTQMANMERMFTERMGKMESEVSQLRDAYRLNGEGPSKSNEDDAPSKSKDEEAPSKSKDDEAPSKSKDDEGPPKRKVGRPPSKSKGDQPTGTKKAGKKIAVQTNSFDFGLSTQDVFDLQQDPFVDGFDLSQVKVENSTKSRPVDMSIPHLLDDTKDAETAPDAALVFLGEEDWEKVTKWSSSSTPLRCGPTVLDDEIAKRLMDPYEWLHNLEIDAAMFVFRERTSLNRWKPYRVGFMTTVFSNMIKKEYNLLRGGRKKYSLHNLLVHHRRHREYDSPNPNHRLSSSSEHGEEEPRFMTFESGLEASRGFFIAGTSVANPWSICHVTGESFRKYPQLCIRGFLVQGTLVLDDPDFAEARTIVDNVGWMYTVLHVRPFCPRVVRECISNLYRSSCRFNFDPVLYPFHECFSTLNLCSFGDRRISKHIVVIFNLTVVSVILFWGSI